MTPDGRLTIYPDPTLGSLGMGQYLSKVECGYVFWGDHLAAIIPILQGVSIFVAIGAIWYLSRLERGGAWCD